MKNMFKFFMVAMMVTAMMFSACNKDDDKNEEPGSEKYQDYGDPFGEDNPYSTAPEFVGYPYLSLGYNFDVKWTSATYIDTTQFVYELFYCSTDLCPRTSLGNHLTQFLFEDLKLSEMKSLGRQRDTIYHFSFEPELFDESDDYVLYLVTYYWYQNQECQIKTYTIFNFRPIITF